MKGFEDWTEEKVAAMNAQRGKKPEFPIGESVELKPIPLPQRFVVQKPTSKYRNVKTMTGDGVRFDSRKEADHWVLLNALAADGMISNLRRQVRFALYAPAAEQPFKAGEIMTIGSRTRVKSVSVQISEYVADFVYDDKDGARRVQDVKSKGTRTAVYKLKKKWLELQDGIIIEEV